MITTSRSEHRSRSTTPLFELDRFELSGGEQCEVHGRWFGVRGRRFMRPMLTVIVDGQRRRLLADLAHKPWPAAEGEPWDAAFPLPPDGELTRAELTVAPDLTVALPTSDAGTAGPRALPAVAASERPAESLGSAQRDDARQRSDAPRPVPAVDDDATHRLQQRITYLEAARTQTAARNNELADEVAQVVRERDALAAERDAALEARDQAQQETQSVRRKAKAALRRAASARDDAFSERDDAIAMRDSAREERDAALAGRDRALAAAAAATRIDEPPEPVVAITAARPALRAEIRARDDEVDQPPLRSWPIDRAIPALLLLAAIVVVLVIALPHL